MEYNVTAFYYFKTLPEASLPELGDQLKQFAKAHGMCGLLLIGPEGINGTVAGPESSIVAWKNLVTQMMSAPIEFKDSKVDKPPFNNFKVKIKNEIVTIGRPNLVPPADNFYHLSPKEWNEAMQDPNTVVIDTRNNYEVEIGKFKKAIDFNIEEFREFPKKLAESGIAKDKKVLIYCTGGIRCEKAILAMHEQGFKDVGQLQGGILNYLEQMPEQEFEGECFVFDYRVAVDQHLQPSKKFTLCPHCGQPAAEKISCIQCGTNEVVCKHCFDKDESLRTCSKNCAHHFTLGSHSTRPHLDEYRRRHRSYSAPT